MQNTRLNTFLNIFLKQLNQWVSMPWRRLSLLIISLLLGNFLASVISTTTGQRATLDAWSAVVLTIATELISWLAYSRLIRQQERISLDESTENSTIRLRRPLWLDFLNGTKIGMVYGLFLDALKLGS
jgi:Protein of unknown function (DUF565)